MRESIGGEYYRRDIHDSNDVYFTRRRANSDFSTSFFFSTKRTRVYFRHSMNNIYDVTQTYLTQRYGYDVWTTQVTRRCIVACALTKNSWCFKYIHIYLLCSTHRTCSLNIARSNNADRPKNQRQISTISVSTGMVY